jgi:outer membrane protein TolC
MRHDCGWKELYAQEHLPPQIDCTPAALDELLAPPPSNMPDPATVLDPDRSPYHLSLGEAFAIALEHGTTGSQFARQPGVPVDDLVSFGGNTVFGSDSIRVLALQPARAGTAIEAALSRFDPQFNTGVAWTNIDEPTQTLLTSTNGELANFFATLAKPLPSGGVVGVTYSTDYQLVNSPFYTGFNPSYVPKVTVGFEQPLLRGFGTEINQLLPNSPGSNLFPVLNGRANGFSPEGILITRIRFDQQRADFERSVNYLLLNVEAAYWNLYGAYVTLYATEQGLRQAQQAWVIFKNRAEVGQGIGIGQLAQVQAQYEQFRGDRMRAVGAVIDNERNLRMLLGMPVEDGKRLIPVDAPTTALVQVDWKAVVHDALSLRPELLMAREEVKARQWNVVLQKNFLMPDLRFQATHTTVGLGTRLDGNGTAFDANGFPVTNNALRSLVGSHFNDWTVGVNLNVPLGFRREHANLRDARLQLVQGYAILRNQENKATTFSARTYSRVIESQRVLEIRRLQREAAAEQLRVRSVAFAEGNKQSPVEFLLSAQQTFASALTQEYLAIVDYNIALASLEFARGTIMRHSRVSIADAPLPPCAERAVDVEHRRVVTRVGEHLHSVPYAQPDSPLPPLPPLPLYGAASLLDLGQGPAPPQPMTPVPIRPVTLAEAPVRPTLPMAEMPARPTAPVVDVPMPVVPPKLSFVPGPETPSEPYETLPPLPVRVPAMLAPPLRLQFGVPSAAALR